MTSTTIGITCAHCAADLGATGHILDPHNVEIFQAHQLVCPVLNEQP